MAPQATALMPAVPATNDLNDFVRKRDAVSPFHLFIASTSANFRDVFFLRASLNPMGVFYGSHTPSGSKHFIPTKTSVYHFEPPPLLHHHTSLTTLRTCTLQAHIMLTRDVARPSSSPR